MIIFEVYYQRYKLRVGPADRHRTQLFLVASAPFPFHSIMVLELVGSGRDSVLPFLARLYANFESEDPKPCVGFLLPIFFFSFNKSTFIFSKQLKEAERGTYVPGSGYFNFLLRSLLCSSPCFFIQSLCVFLSFLIFTISS